MLMLNRWQGKQNYSAPFGRSLCYLRYPSSGGGCMGGGECSIVRKHSPRRMTTDQEIMGLGHHPWSSPWNPGGTGKMSEGKLPPATLPPPSHTNEKGGF